MMYVPMLGTWRCREQCCSSQTLGPQISPANQLGQEEEDDQEAGDEEFLEEEDDYDEE